MKLQIKAVGLDLTPATETYARDKIGRLEKLIVTGHRDSALADIKLIFAPSNTKDTKDKCHVTISGIGGGKAIHVETEEPEMHVAIDRAAHKLKEPLRRDQERYRDHLRRESAEVKRKAADLGSGEGDLT
jgi:ribosomal subunit interface protein